MDLQHEKRVETTNLAGVLQLVMQHTSAWHPQDLCRLLQVSSSCRAAVRLSRCKCDVELRFEELNLTARSKLQGFAEWLPSHTGLVSGLVWLHPEECESPEQEQECQLLQRQLALALRVCRLNAAAAARSTGDLATAMPPLPLQLTVAGSGFSWPEPQLLRELAAARLQELLVVGVRQEPAQVSRSYYACFATLSSLQRLSIQCDAHGMVHPAGFMSAVQQLSALTSLHSNMMPVDAAHQLPPQLQDLTARFVTGSISSTVVSLSHLAALRQLDCYAASDVTEGLQMLLPPYLTCLHLTTNGKVSRVKGAAALQVASVHDLNDTGVDVLVHLCSLRVLVSLSVDSSHFSTSAASQVAIAALGSATALTRLVLLDVCFADDIALWKQLAKLSRLVDLDIRSYSMPGDRSDLLGLTTLTSLTRLALETLGPQPDDVVAAAVAHHSTGLCELRLTSNSMTSLALLPVVGVLTGLSRLCLCGGEQFVVGAGDLMLLSRLTKLEDLVIRKLNCSKAEQQQFLAGMPHLRKIQLG